MKTPGIHSLSAWRSQFVISSFHPTPRMGSQVVTPPRDIHSELADLKEDADARAAKTRESFERFAV